MPIESPARDAEIYLSCPQEKSTRKVSSEMIFQRKGQSR